MKLRDDHDDCDWREREKGAFLFKSIWIITSFVFILIDWDILLTLFFHFILHLNTVQFNRMHSCDETNHSMFYTWKRTIEMKEKRSSKWDPTMRSKRMKRANYTSTIQFRSFSFLRFCLHISPLLHWFVFFFFFPICIFRFLFNTNRTFESTEHNTQTQLIKKKKKRQFSPLNWQTNARGRSRRRCESASFASWANYLLRNDVIWFVVVETNKEIRLTPNKFDEKKKYLFVNFFFDSFRFSKTFQNYRYRLQSNEQTHHRNDHDKSPNHFWHEIFQVITRWCSSGDIW